MTNPVTPGGFALGLIPDEPDDRDQLYAAAPAPYEFVDLETVPATPPIWDQGQLGSCTAHGGLACFMFAAAKAGESLPMLSRLQAYYNTRAIEGTVSEDAGGQLRDAIKALAAGVAPETDWPYDITKFAEEPPAKAQADATNKAITYARVGTDRNAIQAVLSEGYPIDIGVTLFSSFEADLSISSGVVPMAAPKVEKAIGGHCMAVWGIGTGADWKAHDQFPTADDATVYVKVRNSWGTSVYQRGYLLLPVEYLANFGSDFWVIKQAN